MGVISPAGPVEASALKAGLEALDRAGLRVRLGAHVFDKLGYMAGDDLLRLHDFHTMFEDSSIKAIFCTRGGYGALRLLDKIRYQLVKENPKILVGFSDITALLMALFSKTGLVTFHGPMVRSLRQEPSQNFHSLLQMVESSGTCTLELDGAKTAIPGNVRGTLVGGNLTLLCHLVGTPFIPSFKGCILVLEDTGEQIYRLDRMLTHLRLSGHFEGVAGIVAGAFEGCGERDAIDGLLLDALQDFQIPLVTDAPIGHGAGNLTLPIGIMAELDATALLLRLMEPCVL